MKSTIIRISHLCLALTLGATIPAQATLLWSGAASGGTGVFKGVEKQTNGEVPNSTNGSTLTAVNDATEGTVWKFHKDDLDRRCEARGANGVTITVGSTYYIGYRFKLAEVLAAPAQGHYFSMNQWKSYGTTSNPITQNYPVLVVINNGNIRVQHFKENTYGTSATDLFVAPVSAGVWYSIVLKIKAGNTASTGSIQVFWGNDSAAETLIPGGTSYTGRTFDGGSVEPKWGYYHQTNRDGNIYFSRLKIGTTYADVKPY